MERDETVSVLVDGMYIGTEGIDSTQEQWMQALAEMVACEISSRPTVEWGLAAEEFRQRVLGALLSGLDCETDPGN